MIAKSRYNKQKFYKEMNQLSRKPPSIQTSVLSPIYLHYLYIRCNLYTFRLAKAETLHNESYISCSCKYLLLPFVVVTCKLNYTYAVSLTHVSTSEIFSPIFFCVTTTITIMICCFSFSYPSLLD